MRIILLWLASTFLLASADDGTERWRQAENLRASADFAAASGKILVVYVTMDGCPYCARLEADLLLAAYSRGELDAVHLVEVQWDERTITDFEGTKVPADVFLGQYGVSITPTMLFLGRDGRQLVDAIAGYQSSDFYWQYLVDAIDQSRELARE